jgi:hypothetical protein
MSNLLSRETKRAMVLEYRVRIAALWCFALALVCASGTLLFAPAFLTLRAEHKYVTNVLNEQAARANPEYAQIVAGLDRANALARVLKEEEVRFTVTDVITEVEGELGTGIAFNGISFVRNEADIPRIEVYGVAHTRDELAQFVERLKNNPYFLDASVPFAQLAQATDASFTATLIVRTTP